jgi:hypothetical protein
MTAFPYRPLWTDNPPREAATRRTAIPSAQDDLP